MAADRKMISQDKQRRSAAQTTRKRTSMVYRGGAKLSQPVVREQDPAWFKEFRKRANPNKIKKA